MNKRSTIALILTLAICLAALCTPVMHAEASGALPVVTFYHGYYQDESEWPVAAAMRAIYQEFADAHKDEFVFDAVMIESGGEGIYGQAVQDAAGGQLSFDIAAFGGWNIVPVASAQGLLLNLKPYLDADPDFKAGVGVFYDQWLTDDGAIYTVSEQVEAVGFWYNEDLFNKAGAALPETWTTPDDFAEAVEALKACPDIVTPFAFNQGWPTNLLLSQVLLGTPEGREMVSNPVTTFDNDAFKDALSFVNANALQQIDTRYFTAGGDDDEQYRRMFFDGEAAMLFNGVWDAGDLGDAKFKPAVFPAADGKKVALVSAGCGYVVNSKLDDVKTNACIEFLKFMASKGVAERILTESIGMPPSSAVDYEALKADASLSVTTLKLIEACDLLEAADYKGLTIGSRWDVDIESAIAGKYAGLKDGSKTVEKVVSELNQLLD